MKMMRKTEIVLLFAVALLMSGSATAQSSESKDRVLFQTGFEEGEASLDHAGFSLDDQIAHQGTRSLRGQIDAPNKARFLMVPVAGKKGRAVSVSFMVRSDKGSVCAVFWTTKKEKIPLTRLSPIPTNKWTAVTCSAGFAEDSTGHIQIACPTSFNAPAGNAWIDSLVVKETAAKRDAVLVPRKGENPNFQVAVPPSGKWPESVIDFPALAADRARKVWMATLERPGMGGEIGVYNMEGEKRSKVCALTRKGVTGVAAPAIAGLDEGCLVVFPFERDDEWNLAYAIVDAKSGKKPKIIELDFEGNANISPSVATAGEHGVVVWESNAPGRRVILSRAIGREGTEKTNTLSDQNVNSYNPTITALEDGSFFAAWDSARGGSIDIYGARLENGKWSAERRLTKDARIERYPHVVSRGSEVWLAWQAQSYQGISVNSIGEQRIVAARVDKEGLSTPTGFFSKFGKSLPFLLRPRISFDARGRLWLTARESGGQHVGWKPVAWVYSGRTWSEKTYLSDHFGQWRPAPMVWAGGKGIAALQADDVPLKRSPTGVANSDWHSDIILAPLPDDLAPEAKPLETEPLAMPATDFSLPEAMEMVAADFPRQKMKHKDKNLTLYWGDLHAHTDLSICGRWWNRAHLDEITGFMQI